MSVRTHWGPECWPCVALEAGVPGCTGDKGLFFCLWKGADTADHEGLKGEVCSGVGPHGSCWCLLLLWGIRSGACHLSSVL